MMMADTSSFCLFNTNQRFIINSSGVGKRPYCSLEKTTIPSKLISNAPVVAKEEIMDGRGGGGRGTETSLNFFSSHLYIIEAAVAVKKV
jgi:hypothetical protein